jgi:hypothetical protein
MVAAAGSNGARLRAALAEQGWSYTRLIAAMRRTAAVDRETLPKTESLITTISRWLNDHERPSEFYQDLLCKALQRSRVQLGFDTAGDLQEGGAEPMRPSVPAPGWPAAAAGTATWWWSCCATPPEADVARALDRLSAGELGGWPGCWRPLPTCTRSPAASSLTSNSSSTPTSAASGGRDDAAPARQREAAT